MSYTMWFDSEFDLFAFTSPDEGDSFPFREGESISIAVEMGPASKQSHSPKDPSFCPDMLGSIHYVGIEVEDQHYSLVKVQSLERDFDVLLKFPWEKENFLFAWFFKTQAVPFKMGDKLYIPFKVSAVIEQTPHIIEGIKWWGYFNPIGQEEFGLIRAEVKSLLE